MNISRRFKIIFSLLILQLAGIIIVMFLWIDSARKVAEAESQGHQLMDLAHILRQSSDDLTRMVRVYVTTGDKVYLEYYEQILAIRNGKQPRPSNKYDLHWDTLVSQQNFDSSAISASTMEQMILNAPLDSQERALLFDALAQSNELVSFELNAIELIKNHTYEQLPLSVKLSAQDKVFNSLYISQ
ncbi:hypothetical protein [Shewanella maritima]|uniref:hypothetical protein n=1 Tax=Shewanella maritima TaxID=2520507 RepID=UPI0037361DE6